MKNKMFVKMIVWALFLGCFGITYYCPAWVVEGIILVIMLIILVCVGHLLSKYDDGKED